MSFFTLLRNPLGDKMNLGQITKDGKCEQKRETESEREEKEEGLVEEKRERKENDRTDRE